MTSVTVQLTAEEIKALKTRTGKRNARAALKAWAAHANAARTSADLRAALKESLREESAEKRKRFRSGREAIRWLES
jgi:translation initiation factor 2B subunit (eIF-2B alpha/beta/delta family)